MDNTAQLIQAHEQLQREITERKRIEQELRVMNEFLSFYRRAIDSMEDYKIAVVDDDYRYTIVSPQYLMGYNLSEAEIVGKTVAELMGDDVFEQIIKPKLDRALGGQVIQYSDWFDIPTKGRRYLEVSYYPIVDENQRVISVAAVSHDLTERKMAEEELCWERDLAEALAEAAAVVSSTLDPDQVLDRILEQVSRVVPNDAANIMLIEGNQARPVRWRGYERFGAEEFISAVIFCLPEVANLQQMMESKEPMVIPDTASYPSWVQFPGQDWLRSYAAAPIVVRGRVIGFLNVDSATPGFFTQAHAEALRAFAGHAAVAIENARLYQEIQQELAERKQAEQALRESEELYQTLVQTSPDAVTATDLEGRITYVSQRTLELHGFESAEELLGRSAFELIAPEDREKAMMNLRKTLKEGFIRNKEYILLKKDGTRFAGELSAALIQDAHGKPKAFIATTRDITERKMAEKALERRASQLATVSEVGWQIASILDPDELLRQIVNLLEEAFGYRYVDILLLDEDSNELVVRAATRAIRGLEGTRIPLQVRSINSHVARTGEPLLVNDVSQQALYQFVEEMADTRAELCVPIKVKGQVIGTLDVQSAKLNAFDESDLFTLQALASQAGIAIENARLYEEAQRRIAELAGLHELSQAFSSVTDVRETYGELTRRMAHLIGCQACTIATYDPKTREMRAQPPGYGAPDELVQTFHYKVDGPAREVWNFRFQGPLLANDIVEIPGFFLQWVEGFNLFNLLIVPMTLEGRITGLVYAANKPGGFTEGDSKLLTIFAGQAAVIIEKARLYEQAQRWAEEMTSVYSIGVATTSTLNLDEVLKSVCDQVCRLMNVSTFFIALYDAERKELSFELALDEGLPVDKFKRRLANGGGLSGWIVQSGRPLLLRDIQKEELPIEAIVVGEPARSWLGVPLLYMDRVVGVMGVQSYQPHAFDEDDQQLLSTIAAQVAIAVENARLFAETRKRANDLSLLLGTSTAISSTLDLDHILETVAHQITTSLVATFCRITLLDEAGETLVVRATSPIRDQDAKGAFGRRCPLATVPWHRQVIETAEPVVLRQDVPERALSEEERKIALTDEVKSAALIPLIVGGRVLGVISLGEERSWERSPFSEEKIELCQSIAAQAAVAIENARLYEELQQSFIQTIATLAAAVEAKDPYTGGHSQRTTELAAAIAQELGLGSEEIELIRYACLLHDVGKIGINEQILGKPGPLDEEEWEVIRRHPVVGADIVERAAALQKLVPIILHHHEHYDGQGYPEGLRGEAIPLKARILAVADAFEAMTSDRAYRPAMTVEQALATLREGADRQWDGKIVAILHKIIREEGYYQ